MATKIFRSILVSCACLFQYISCQQLFSIAIGRWSECQRIDNSFVLYKTRNVTCMYKDNQVAPWYYCEQLGLPRPSNSSLCDKVMPINCVTSFWSSWSFVNSSSVQYRHRNIVLPPMFGGQKCPHTYENKLCSNCTMNYWNYQWKVGHWGSCEPLLGPSNCGHGIRHRNITCISRYGHTVSESVCSAVFKPHNFEFENCEVPCDCTVSEWSPWSECKLNYDTIAYQQIRTRIILNYPSHSTMHSLACPSLQETRPCGEGVLNCNWTYEVSGWSGCKVYDNNSDCGAGLRTRFIYCEKSCGNYTSYVDLSECNDYLNSPPTTLETCYSACDQDCHLSQWSEWSYCTPFQSCNAEIPGYTFRERSIVIPQSRSGRPCSHTIEIRNCIPHHCIHPRWHIRNTSACHLTSNMTCGIGVITRDIDCVDHRGISVSADECLMHHSEMPSEVVSCQVPCSDECVVNEWSMWSQCSRTCSGGFRKRNRQILAYGATNCSSIKLQEIESCNEEINCTSYKLYYGEWSKCNSVAPLNISTSYCYNGTQTRSATCKIGNTIVACPGYFGKDTSRQCTECRNNCIKSEWYYTPCSATCGNDGYQLKYRTVLWQGEYGACTNVDDDGRETMYEACLNMPSCQNYTWAISEWSKCYLPNDEVCGIGYKNRSVYCVNSINQEIEDYFCIKSTVSKHNSFKDCIVPCHNQCILKKWSQFGPCSKLCGDSPGTRSRARHVILPPGATGTIDENCPELKSTNLVEEKQCDVPEYTHYKWITSSWSSCSVTNKWGDGVQTRTVACASITANATVLVSNSLCEQHSSLPDSTQNCSRECPVDCIVTDWTNWESCSAGCGIGTTTRYRTVLQAPNALGRPCPGLQQTTTCKQRSCGEYKPSEWNTCVIANVTNSTEYCGNGIMFQNYSCYVDRHVSENIFCDNTIPVTVSQDCYLPCSGDCVMSEWTIDLTTCSDCIDGSCNTTATRKILQKPLSSGKQCGPLVRIEPCPTVNNYYWHTGPWLSCVLLNKSHLCGNGFQHREVKCISRHNSQIVPDYHCNEVKTRPSHKKLCNVKCPVDCVVTAFEPWPMCDTYCNINSTQTRHRDIILNPNEHGRPCPHLKETRYCKIEINRCYSYHLSYSQWSSCELNTKGKYCGNLTRHRSVTCRRSDGAYVGNEKCADQYNNSSLHTEESCAINCKQEKCQYSGWSNWSRCTAIETKNNAKFKFRSRYLLSYEPYISFHEVDCLSDQYETKECDDYNDTRLLSVKWKVNPWHSQADSRDVWCESSDMISVTQSACAPILKPSDTLCTGGCSKAFYCDQISGYCQCGTGLELISGQCLPLKGCLTNAHCFENTECENLTCVCSQGYHMNDNKCTKNIEPSIAMTSSPTPASSSNPEVASSKLHYHTYS